ncbi:MAG: glycosyltransferase family 39 protein, partial [Caldilinea sp.]
MILYTELPLLVRTLAALVIVGVAPATLLTAWLAPRHGGGGQATMEQGVFVAALAFTTMTMGMLLLSYLPGGVARWQVLLFYDMAMAGMAVGLWLKRRQSIEEESAVTQGAPDALSALDAPRRRWLVTGVLVLLMVGALVRFPGLGYAEFHGDEARAVLRASAIIQGHEDVLLIHRKGPVEILAPAALFALTGEIDEASARLPFALAGLAGLFAIWLVGWRLLTPAAGWIAALLLAVTGYYVAFSRFLQYQSVVILTTAAAILAIAALLQSRDAPIRRLLLAALLFATGLLAHYDALAAAPPLAVLFIAALLQRRTDRRALVFGALLALAAGMLTLALSYVPFVLNPAFRATVDYLLGDRIGSSPPYSNLDDLFVRGALYNSAYLMGLLITLSLIGLISVFLRGYGRRWGIVFSGIALIAVTALTLNRGALALSGFDMTAVLVVPLLVLACCAPGIGIGRRASWVWFTAAFVVFIFLIEEPRTHVHVFFAPWALIAGDLLVTAWRASAAHLSGASRRWVIATGAGAIALLFGAYAYQLYIRNDVEVLRTWPAHAPVGYWNPGGGEAVDGRFGYPFTNGWKVVGELYNQGEISGDYETNQRYMWAPAWYTRSQHRCGSTAEWYFAVNSLEPWMEDQSQIADQLREQGFSEWGVVTVNGDDRMTIYRNSPDGQKGEVRRLALEDFAPSFDAGATAALPLSYPIITESPQHKLDVTFGDEIRLEGYDLLPKGPLQPNQSFRLKLYWRAIAPSTGSHKVSV